MDAHVVAGAAPSVPRTARLRLEPDDEQSSRPVLRGLGFGNEARLPDAAPGGALAAIVRNRAWWSSTVAPAAQRQAVLSAALMAARRSVASRSSSPLRSTASLW